MESLQVGRVTEEHVWVLVNHGNAEVSERRNEISHPLLPVVLVLNYGVSEGLVHRLHRG